MKQENAAVFRVAGRCKTILGPIAARVSRFYKRLGFFYLTFGAGFFAGCAFTGFLCGFGKLGSH